MKKLIFIGAVASLFLGTTIQAQVSNPTNLSTFGNPFVGFNGAGPFGPQDLQIRNDFNRPVTLHTNGTVSFATYTVQHRIKTPPKTSTLAH